MSKRELAVMQKQFAVIKSHLLKFPSGHCSALLFTYAVLRSYSSDVYCVIFQLWDRKGV